MKDYSELVKALRLCQTDDGCESCIYKKDMLQQFCWIDAMADAAAAIEALQAQLPKRGKWVTHPEVKNIYGGVYIECPFCGEKYVVQNVSDEKFCRNCGADLRAKMEVQDG